jgi:hypothetical protein
MGAFFKPQSIYSFCMVGAIGSFLALSKSPDRIKADSYNPMYIISKDKERFSQQEDYLQKARQIIEMGQSLIKASFPGNERELFSSLLSYFSKARASLAKQHNTENAEDFGLRRDQQERGAHSILLKDAYEECGKQVLSWMKKTLLEEMVQMGSSGALKIIKESHAVRERFLDCESGLYFELFSPKQVDKWSRFSEKSNLEYYVPHEVLQKKERGEPLSKKEQRLINQAVQKIQALYPDYNESHDMNFVLQLMDWESASGINASDCYLIRATTSLKMKGNVHFLTRYNVLLHQEDTLETMEKLGVVLLHQDVSLIQETLDEAATVFQNILKWNGKDLSSLQDQMALLTYLLVHNMRDARGSAAENEWLTHAVYGALNVKISEDPNKLQDLEAFAHPLLFDFVNVYKNMIKLEHKPTGL